jgi:hypothetical protein
MSFPLDNLMLFIKVAVSAATRTERNTRPLHEWSITELGFSFSSDIPTVGVSHPD